MKTNTKPSQPNAYYSFALPPNTVALALLLVSFLIFLILSANSTRTNLLPYSMIPLIAGLVFEGRGIEKDWKSVALPIVICLGLSVFAFFPGRHEDEYDVEWHLQLWPYVFMAVYLTGIASFYPFRMIVKLSEGITLLQSLAILYWIIDFGFTDSNFVTQAFMMVAFGFASFNLFHALTYTPLSRNVRLALSIWSSVIMMFLAAYNLIRLYFTDATAYSLFNTHVFIGLQFFLTGISAIHLMQSIFVMYAFLPGKGSFFNYRYYSEVRELANSHVKRYSESQVTIYHAIIYVVSVTIVYALNFYYKVLPAYMAIWIVFTILPFLIDGSSVVGEDSTEARLQAARKRKKAKAHD